MVIDGSIIILVALVSMVSYAIVKKIGALKQSASKWRQTALDTNAKLNKCLSQIRHLKRQNSTCLKCHGDGEYEIDESHKVNGEIVEKFSTVKCEACA